MSSKRALYGRLLARAQAVQMLFQAESAGRPVADVLAGDYVVTRGPIDEYGEQLALAVAGHVPELDRVIAHVADNWSLNRIPQVDKNILRLALYELFFEDELENNVAISEAVNLAKVFGGEDSYVFVNGVLGRVARDMATGVDFLALEPEPEDLEEPGIEAEAVAELSDDPEALAESLDAALADDEPLEAADPDIASGEEIIEAERADA